MKIACALAAAILVLASTSAYAAPPKPKPIIGGLVLAGTTSPVTAYSWEVTADSSFIKGSGASVGKPVPGAIRITKVIDGSSISALKTIAAGTAFASAVFTVTFGKGNAASTMAYELDELFVTSVAQGAADGLVTEDVSFVFSKVKWTFRDSSGNVTTGSWDVSSGDVE